MTTIKSLGLEFKTHINIRIVCNADHDLRCSRTV